VSLSDKLPGASISLSVSIGLTLPSAVGAIAGFEEEAASVGRTRLTSCEGE
jgi:hypothetical protein